MNVKHALFTMLGLALAAASTPAFAVDGKVYPGSGCDAYTESSEDLLQRFADYVENTSTQYSALVMCPAVKDNVGSGSGTNYVRVSYYKQDTTGFFCAFYAKSASGGSTQTSSEWDFGNSGNKTMVLDNVSSYNGGTYSFYCILPPGARLHSYRVDEN